MKSGLDVVRSKVQALTLKSSNQINGLSIDIDLQWKSKYREGENGYYSWVIRVLEIPKLLQETNKAELVLQVKNEWDFISFSSSLTEVIQVGCEHEQHQRLLPSLAKVVKENQLLTADGMSYLETKHLLLLSYCQSIVYYLLRKAKGLSIEDHPVVHSLVEIRLFLEKIRPIDKKLEYQVQKLIKAAGDAGKEQIVGATEQEKKEGTQDGEDPLKYRPNPDMLVSKISEADQDGGVYRPPRFAPTRMDDDKDKVSKQEKQAMRREKELLRKSKQSSYWKELVDDFEDRPEEVQEMVGSESRELSRYLSKREEQEKQEEELFIRAPITKRDKKLEKHLRMSRNGLAGLTDGFDDVLRVLPQKENGGNDIIANFNTSRGKGFKKRKRNH